MASNCDGFPGCRCNKCLKFTKECCGTLWPSWTAYRKHETTAHAKNYSRHRPPHRTNKTCIVPDGLGGLKTIITTPERLASVSLGALTRYAAALNAERHLRKARFSRAERTVLGDLRDGKGAGFIDVKTAISNDQALVIYELAQAINIPVKSVASLLVSYGLELLAKELRNTGAAPAPKQPTSVISSTARAKTARQEFLEENGVRVNERETTVLEFLPRPKPDKSKNSDAEVQVPTVFVPKLDLPRVPEQVQDTPKQTGAESVPTKGVHSRGYIPRA